MNLGKNIIELLDLNLVFSINVRKYRSFSDQFSKEKNEEESSQK